MPAVLDEIEDWKLEAKLEDNARYFYHTRVVDQLTSGKKLYVIGRKGTGKTAITENLISRKEENCYAQKLTFKNFPFNVLYGLEDKGFSAPNQYITLWKYVIYTATCKLLSTNPAVDLETRNQLAKIFDDDIEKALSKALEKWTKSSFNISILGVGAGTSSQNTVTENNTDWTEKVEILEKFLFGIIGNSKYIIVFDELDEDYKDVLEKEKYSRYTQLLTSLFKAVQDIRSRFKKHQLYPIICLRDDIYEILQDPDKTKWIDLKVDLEWNVDSIKNLIAFRISRALDSKGPILSFQDAWQSIFQNGKVKVGHQKNKILPSFDYILRSTLLRPRDFIRYIQICAAKTIDKGSNKISAETVSECDSTFSNYLRSEIEDELHGIIPDIHSVFDLFTVIRKQTLRIDEFKESYDRAHSEGKMQISDPYFVLQILFLFSAIGNQPKQITHQIFKYKNKDARLNTKENIIIHRGLYRSLQIL